MKYNSCIFGCLILFLLVCLCFLISGCGKGDVAYLNEVSFEQYVEVKPVKGFLNQATITVNDFHLTQDMDRALYLGFLPQGKELSFGDIFRSVGGTIRDTGIPMDKDIPMSYIYDGKKDTILITPLTTLVAESMILSGEIPCLENIDAKKDSLLGLIDPDNRLLGGDRAKVSADPEAIPELEGLGHTIYFTIKGTVDLMKAFGIQLDSRHISIILGSILDTFASSENTFDEVLIEIISGLDLGAEKFFESKMDIVSVIIQEIYNTARDKQDAIIIAQKKGNIDNLKKASLNVSDKIFIMSNMAPAIYNTLNEKSHKEIEDFFIFFRDVINENMNTFEQKTFTDHDDRMSELSSLMKVILDEINDLSVELPDSTAPVEPDPIDPVDQDEPQLLGIEDWIPKDGMVIDSIEADFYLIFSKPVNKDEIEKKFEITILGLDTGMKAKLMCVNEKTWVFLTIPGLGKICQRVAEDEYIYFTWTEDDLKMIIHVRPYTIYGMTFSLGYGHAYEYTLKLNEGATFQDGDPIKPETIGPLIFSIAE